MRQCRHTLDIVSAANSWVVSGSVVSAAAAGAVAAICDIHVQPPRPSRGNEITFDPQPAAVGTVCRVQTPAGTELGHVSTFQSKRNATDVWEAIIRCDDKTQE